MSNKWNDTIPFGWSISGIASCYYFRNDTHNFFSSELYSDIESIWIIVISSEWFDKDKKIKSEFYENRRHLSVSWRDFYNLNKCSTNSCMLSIRFLYWYIRPFWSLHFSSILWIRISTQLSAITFSIQLEFYLWKATLKRSGRAKMKGSCKVESLHDQFIQWIFVKNGHIQLALINFCQNDEEIKKNLTSMSTYQLYVNEMVVRIVVEI